MTIIGFARNNHQNYFQNTTELLDIVYIFKNRQYKQTFLYITIIPAFLRQPIPVHILYQHLIVWAQSVVATYWMLMAHHEVHRSKVILLFSYIL